MEEADRSHICPVCRKHKFKWFNASEECSVCGWIDDAVQEKYPDWGGCQNDMSLNEARKAYKEGRPIEQPWSNIYSFPFSYSRDMQLKRQLCLVIKERFKIWREV